MFVQAPSHGEGAGGGGSGETLLWCLRANAHKSRAAVWRRLEHLQSRQQKTQSRFIFFSSQPGTHACFSAEFRVGSVLQRANVPWPGAEQKALPAGLRGCLLTLWAQSF